MQVAEIASLIEVDASVVRMFMSRHKIPRHKELGKRGVFVDVNAYIAALRKRGYAAEADRLELRRRSG